MLHPEPVEASHSIAEPSIFFADVWRMRSGASILHDEAPATNATGSVRSISAVALAYSGK